MKVTLLCGPLVAHYTQIFTGLTLLERLGRIRIRQRYHDAGLAAIIDDNRRVYFDVQDDWAIDPQQLAAADAYFKRSYAPQIVAATAEPDKIRPMGLNYQVFPDGLDLKSVPRALRLGDSWRARLGWALKGLNLHPGFVPRLRHLAAHPAPRQEPRVLFLTRTWEPDGHVPKAMPTREEINDMRARCIVAIRREFGARAIAGFAPSEVARTQYPDLVYDGPTDQRSYLRLLREVPICVATTGLHGSIGWKMGEYVAFAKAIVSERLHYVVPGLQADHHYLEFSGVDNLLAAVSRLFDDAGQRHAMMHANAAYYRDYLRPDRLVWRALRGAAS